MKINPEYDPNSDNEEIDIGLGVKLKFGIGHVAINAPTEELANDTALCVMRTAQEIKWAGDEIKRICGSENCDRYLHKMGPPLFTDMPENLIRSYAREQADRISKGMSTKGATIAEIATDLALKSFEDLKAGRLSSPAMVTMFTYTNFLACGFPPNLPNHIVIFLTKMFDRQKAELDAKVEELRRALITQR